MDWPGNLIPQQCSLALKKATLQFRSPFNGNLQVVDLLSDRWVLSLTLPERALRRSGEAEALFAYLSGGSNTISCWHFARERPRGTISGTPLLDGIASIGDSSIDIKGATAYTTLLAGDILGLGNQLLQVLTDVTFDQYGDATVALANRVRTAAADETALVTYRPKAPFICSSTLNAITYRPGAQQAAAIELEEVW